MRERVAALVGGRGRRPCGSSTFHSACVRILRREAAHGRAEVDVLDLRRRRQPAADAPGAARPRPRPQALPAAVVLRAGVATSRTSSSTRRPTPRPGAEANHHDRMVAEAYTAVPAPAAPGQRPRLRRPHHDDGQRPAGLPRRRRVLPPPLPARARRRVPGHQPRPVPAGQGAGRRRPAADGATRSRRPSCASSATPTSRSTPSAARRSATSSSSSSDYPDARTILLEQNYRSTQTHPARRQLRHRPQRGAPRQEPVDRLRRRRR